MGRKERHDRQTRTLIRLKQAFDGILKDRIDTLSKHLDSVMDMIDNNEDRVRMRGLWNTSKQAAFDAVAHMLSLERQLGLTTLDLKDQAVRDTVGQLEALLRTLGVPTYNAVTREVHAYVPRVVPDDAPAADED